MPEKPDAGLCSLLSSVIDQAPFSERLQCAANALAPNSELVCKLGLVQFENCSKLDVFLANFLLFFFPRCVCQPRVHELFSERGLSSNEEPLRSFRKNPHILDEGIDVALGH